MYKLIQLFSVTNNIYENALQLLEDEFFKKDLLVDDLLSKILEIKPKI